MTFFARTTLVLSAVLLFPVAAFAKPTISEVSPLTATAGTPVTLGAYVSSAVPIEVCRLYVDLADVGPMTVSGGRASASYTFPSGGSRIAFVFCRDTSGGASSGATTAINVSGARQNEAPLDVSGSPSSPGTLSSPPPTFVTIPVVVPIYTPTVQTAPVVTPPVSPDAGLLLKATCPPEPSVDDACHAVYYIGKDGMRHAFPNSRVFFTWYGGFESVREVPLSSLSNYPLGQNVQYRAGIRMVKFTTDPKVYAVSRGGVLRWIRSEELARAYYGNEWNKQIDDLTDAFYTNYTFGTDVAVVSDYNPADEIANSRE
jgi:hypothetical protein